MAWLQTDPSSGTQHICFRFRGKRFRRSLGTKDRKKARRKLARLEDTIELIEMGRVELPTNVDVPTFLLSDGKLEARLMVKDEQLSSLFDAFFDSIPEGSLEERTIAQMHSHRVHLEKHFTKTFSLAKLSFTDLQGYVAARSKGKGIRGRNTNPNTIKKEIVTLRGVWKWSIAADRIPKAAFPSSGLRYPKSTELPIFQTFDEVVKQTKRLDPDSNKAKDLWSSVFLNRDEIESLLDHVQKTARHDFIYPMFVFAAHTGARRSEILRSQLVDIGKDVVAIRERKRRKRTNSMRHVPISSRLQDALRTWKKSKPSSIHTLCNVKGRCNRSVGTAITIDQSNIHFRTTLGGSQFKHLRGWHVFRHSFCSNCAAQGIDQRVIDSWVGHTTEEMRRRYRHLFPNTSKAALQSVFG